MSAACVPMPLEFTDPDYAPVIPAESITIASVQGLSTALAGKADAEHGHEIADVEGLPEALDSKVSS